MPDPEVVERLDTIISILELAFSEQIEHAREKLYRDPINAAIFEALALGPLAAGDLQDKVKSETGQSVRTIQLRLAGLLQQRSLERTGAGPRGCLQEHWPALHPAQEAR